MLCSILLVHIRLSGYNCKKSFTANY